MQNLSYENEFDLHENEPAGETHFHMNSFAHLISIALSSTGPCSKYLLIIKPTYNYNT